MHHILPRCGPFFNIVPFVGEPLCKHIGLVNFTNTTFMAREREIKIDPTRLIEILEINLTRCTEDSKTILYGSCYFHVVCIYIHHFCREQRDKEIINSMNHACAN